MERTPLELETSARAIQRVIDELDIRIKALQSRRNTYWDSIDGDKIHADMERIDAMKAAKSLLEELES